MSEHEDEFDWQGFSQAMKDQSVERRASNRENSADILRKHGVSFEVRNDGAHLLVKHPTKRGVVFDFWPGTGKFHEHRTNDYSQRGVFRLLKRLGVGVLPEYQGPRSIRDRLKGSGHV